MKIEIITELFKAITHIQKAINELKEEINNTNETDTNSKAKPEVRIWLSGVSIQLN